MRTTRPRESEVRKSYSDAFLQSCRCAESEPNSPNLTFPSGPGRGVVWGGVAEPAFPRSVRPSRAFPPQ